MCVAAFSGSPYCNPSIYSGYFLQTFCRAFSPLLGISRVFILLSALQCIISLTYSLCSCFIFHLLVYEPFIGTSTASIVCFAKLIVRVLVLFSSFVHDRLESIPLFYENSPQYSFSSILPRFSLLFTRYHARKTKVL